ncbi:MAG TPA: hypothetical protein VH186_23260 [Chloroflexia bacterium]|nr:hypothetical protein [Chloroflexia bacterium]
MINWRYYLPITFESDCGEKYHFKSPLVYKRGNYRVSSKLAVLSDLARAGEPRLASFR